MRLIRTVGNLVLTNRLGTSDARAMITHQSRHDRQLVYVFAAPTLMLFVIEIVTGICLALVYVLAADQGLPHAAQPQL